MLKSRCRVTLAAQVQARQGIIRGAHKTIQYTGRDQAIAVYGDIWYNIWY